MYLLVSKPFPKIYYVAFVCEGYDFLVCNSLADARNEFVEVGVDLVHPALLVAFACCKRIDLGAYAYHAGNDTGLRLRS